jgi:hypothetical protein
MTEPTELPTVAVDKPSAVKQSLDQLKKMATGTVTLIAEIAIIAFIGSTVGNYLTAKTIVSDCATVNLAKIGDAYVNCTVVAPKKDGEQTPPR